MTELVTPAVVLRTRQFREADLIVILLTPGHGKIDCIARGARRSRRRFPGGLPTGARGEASIGRGRGSLAPLAGFCPSVDLGVLGRDLEVFAYVAYLCELTDQLIGGSAPDAAVFGRLCEALEDVCSRGAQPAALRRFELGLLDGLGLLPALDACSACGSPAHARDDGVAFSVQRGGLLCLAHARAARRIPAAVPILAGALLHGDAETRAEVYAGADRATRRGLRDLCRELIAPHLRGPLRSLAFFAQIAAKPGEPVDVHE